MKSGGAILLLLALCVLPAAGQSPQDRAEAEAKSWLKPCHERGEGQGLCWQNQRNFVEQYVYAKAGDSSAQGSTAYSFTVKQDEFGVGYPHDIIQGCAWYIIRAANPDANQGDAVAARSACSRLNDFQRATAAARANQILAAMLGDPVAVPADDWEPRIAGAPPPPPPLPARCLDSTACALNDTSCPAFVPPPGCPNAPKSRLSKP